MAITRCVCGHSRETHLSDTHCWSRHCEYMSYQSSEQKTFKTPPEPKYILTADPQLAHRAVVFWAFGGDEVDINPDATDTEIRDALKTCAVQLCKLNTILGKIGLPTGR